MDVEVASNDASGNKDFTSYYLCISKTIHRNSAFVLKNVCSPLDLDLSFFSIHKPLQAWNINCTPSHEVWIQIWPGEPVDWEPRILPSKADDYDIKEIAWLAISFASVNLFLSN